MKRNSVEEKVHSPQTSPKGATQSNNNNTNTPNNAESKKGTNPSPAPNRSSLNNSLKKSDKETFQDELSEYPRHKYQTIQSFRPEEVKELLAQHFMKISSDAQHQSSTRSNSITEDGRRRFFHLRPGRRSGPVTGSSDGDSGDGSFTDDLGSASAPGTGSGLRAFVALKQENIHARTSFKVEHDQSADHAEASGAKDPSKRLSRKETHILNNYGQGGDKDKIIQELKDQLSRERRINSEHLNKMRTKQKKLKVKMILQQEKLDALLLLIEAREHNVQAKLNAALENE